MHVPSQRGVDGLCITASCQLSSQFPSLGRFARAFWLLCLWVFFSLLDILSTGHSVISFMHCATTDRFLLDTSPSGSSTLWLYPSTAKIPFLSTLFIQQLSFFSSFYFRMALNDLPPLILAGLFLSVLSITNNINGPLFSSALLFQWKLVVQRMRYILELAKDWMTPVKSDIPTRPLAMSRPVPTHHHIFGMMARIFIMHIYKSTSSMTKFEKRKKDTVHLSLSVCVYTHTIEIDMLVSRQGIILF